MAASSLVLFWVHFRRAEVTVGKRRIRTFKHENQSIPIEIGSGGTRWVRLTSVRLEGRPGLTGEIRQLDSGASELTLTPVLAGSSDHLSATLRASDPLGLFTKQRSVALDLVLEVLPLALREPPLPLVISPFSFGESPAGGIGAGQELYAVSEYQSGLDPRDIMWKRVAGMTDETLPMRVREANVKKVVSIGIKVGSTSDDEKARRKDLIAEALARLGVRLFLVGTHLEITYSSPSGVRRVVASNIRELADATGLARADDDPALSLPLPVSGSYDLAIAGPEELAGARLARLPRFRRLLVLSDGFEARHLPPGASVFTGRENLTDVATSVISG